MNLRDPAFVGSISEAWTPLDLGSKLLAYYDETSFMAAGGKVSQWTDLGPSGQHLVQATGVSQPPYSETGYNGIPAVTFNGAGHLACESFAMGGGTAVGAFFALREYYTLVITDVALSFLASGQTDDSDNEGSARWLMAAGDGYGTIKTQRNGVNVSYSDPDPVTKEFTDFPTRVSVVFDGAALTLYSNNASKATGAATGSFAATGRLRLGARALTVPDWFWHGAIGRLVMAKDTTPGDRILIDAWLARPGSTVSRVAVCEGDSITYKAEISSGYTYVSLPNLSPRAFLHNMAIGGSRLNTNAGDLVDRSADIDALVPANKDGKQYVFYVDIGHNDCPVPGASAAWIATLQSYCLARRAAGFDKVCVATILSRSDAEYADHNTNRALVNPLIRTMCTANDFGLCDFAADATIGADGASDDTNLYDVDKVHPKGASHVTYLEPIFRAAINSV